MHSIDKIIHYTKNMQLLYVEDNKSLQDSTLGVFEQFFLKTHIANNGQEGLEIFESKQIDLVITDINMPVMTGLAMIEKIKKINSKVPVLVLSAHSETDFFMQSIKLGVEGYLLKPIDPSQFVDVMGKIAHQVMLESEAKKNAHVFEQYKHIVDKSSMVTMLDEKKNIIYINDAFCAISKVVREDIIEQNYCDVFHCNKKFDLNEKVWQVLEEEKKMWQGVIEFISKDHKVYYLKTAIQPILDENNTIIEFVILQDDITNVMNPQKQLNDLIASCTQPVIVYFRLDKYQMLQEFYENSVLEDIQDRVHLFLEKHLPTECNFDRVFRLSNGEYAMAGEKSIVVRDDVTFVQNIKKFQDVIKKGIIKFGTVSYDMSIIVSMVYEGNRVLESAKFGIIKLLKTNQSFMIANNFANLERQIAKSNMDMLSVIKDAVENKRIVCYHQGIVDNETKKIVKYESLVRLIDVNNGRVLTPFFFLDVAKKGGYYPAITKIIIQRSFQALKETDKEITVNLSSIDIEDEEIRAMIYVLLEQNEDIASRLVFELLEDEQIKDFLLIKDFVAHVKNFGVKIAIDDFGSGYSNFHRLMEYQPDILKIDGSLIKNLERDPYAYDILDTIVVFAKKQKLLLVAEFVENEDIFNIVKRLKIDFSQGYYFYKPEMLT